MQDSSPALAETGLPGARVPGEPVLFRLSAMSRAVLMAMLLAMLLFATAQHMGGLLGKDPLFLDFNVFYMVGEYVWQGRVAETYDFGLFAPAQDAVNGPDQGFMPWTYPAQMDLFVALLALLPRWLAYFAFAAGSLAGFLWVLKRLAGVHFDAALVLVLPALMVTLLTGQNGMMTAALVGSYALLALRGTRFCGRAAGADGDQAASRGWSRLARAGDGPLEGSCGLGGRHPRRGRRRPRWPSAPASGPWWRKARRTPAPIWPRGAIRCSA